MRCSVVVLLFAILASANCKLKHEALRVAIGKFLKASFEHTTNCMESSGASEESVAKFWNHEDLGENNQALKCYLHCSYLKTGIIDEKGGLLIDALMNKNGVIHQIVSHHPQVIEKLTEFCMDPQSPDPCESSYLLTQCGFKWVIELT